MITKSIYALTDNSIPFYVGQSQSPLSRYKSHRIVSKRLITAKDIKIQDILKNGREYSYIIIKKCKAEDADRFEIQSIKQYKKEGIELINKTLPSRNNKIKLPNNNIFKLKEIKILQLIADDNYTKDISKITRLSMRTIESSRSRMIYKAKVKGTAGLIVYGFRNKLIH